MTIILNATANRWLITLSIPAHRHGLRVFTARKAEARQKRRMMKRIRRDGKK